MYRVERLEGRTLFASYSAATAAELIAAINATNASNQADTITLAAGATVLPDGHGPRTTGSLTKYGTRTDAGRGPSPNSSQGATARTPKHYCRGQRQ